MMPSVKVTRISGDMSDALAGFYRKAWTKTATGDAVRRARAEAARLNPATPGADDPGVAYLREGEVIGHLGTIPVKFWNGQVGRVGHWLKGFMVLPEYQNGSVGFSLLKEMLNHVEISGVMTVALPARRLFQAVGFVDCGVIPNYISVLRPRRVAARIDISNLGLGLPTWLDRSARAAQKAGVAWAAGAVAGGGLRTWRFVAGSSAGLSTDISGGLPPQSDLDELWVRARPQISAGAVRDGAFLSWRYGTQTEGPYEMVSVYRRTGERELVAVAVVRACSDNPDPRLRGIRVATLADILFRADDPAAGLAALAGAERIARRMGADAILCSTAHPAITSALRRRAYVRLPGNVHLMLRDPMATTGLPLTVDAWWLMRGDASSDETF